MNWNQAPVVPSLHHRKEGTITLDFNSFTPSVSLERATGVQPPTKSFGFAGGARHTTSSRESVCTRVWEGR
jgi:hypothetical protein